VQCGTGYRQGSVGCRACDYAYYPDVDSGACLPCVRPSDPWTIIRPIVIFLGALAAVGVVMLCVVMVLRHMYGGSIIRGLKLTQSFVISTFVAVQSVVTIGREAESGLPSAPAPGLRCVWVSSIFKG
jgi:hypothetical protein